MQTPVFSQSCEGNFWSIQLAKFGQFGGYDCYFSSNLEIFSNHSKGRSQDLSWFLFWRLPYFSCVFSFSNSLASFSSSMRALWHSLEIIFKNILLVDTFVEYYIWKPCRFLYQYNGTKALSLISQACSLHHNSTLLYFLPSSQVYIGKCENSAEKFSGP